MMHQHGDLLGGGAQAADTVRDPVCGMQVSTDSPHNITHGGETYRFCSERCQERFVADPSRYAAHAPEPLSACWGRSIRPCQRWLTRRGTADPRTS